MGITLNVGWNEPKTSSAEDKAAAIRGLEFQLGWFAHAIYVNGDYPEVMKKQIAMKSKAQGLKQSRLPTFTESEKAFIKRKDLYMYM